MVPAHSHKVPRVSWYSGFRHAHSRFAYGAFTLFRRSFQFRSAALMCHLCGPNPRTHALWFGLFPFRSPLLWKSNVSFSSSGYLDVSVHRVPLHDLWIQSWIHGVFPCGFPHSDIRGSLDICSSPRLFAAYHVFLRLSVPRHPPCALSCLTFSLCLPSFFTPAVRPANCTDNLRQQIFCSLYSVIEIGLRFGSFLVLSFLLLFALFPIPVP